MNNISEFVQAAIVFTKSTASEYFSRTISQRAGLDASGQPNIAATGSVYPSMTPAMIEDELLSSKRVWKEVVGHPAISPGTRVFETNLAGEAGMVKLSELHSETKVLLASPAKGGNLFPIVSAESSRTASPITHVIIGMNDPDKPFFVTFHPGELVPRSEVSPNMVSAHHRLTTVKDFLLGKHFAFAKVVDRRTWLLELGLRWFECQARNEVSCNGASFEEVERLVKEKLSEKRRVAEKYEMWWVKVSPSDSCLAAGNTGCSWGYMLAPSEEHAKEEALYGGGMFADMNFREQFDPRGGHVTLKKVA